MSGQIETLRVDGHEMDTYVAAGEGDTPRPGIVVIMHAGGVDEFTRAMADRLADEGYAAAAPDLYHWKGPDEDRSPRTIDDAEMTKDVEATVAYLQSRPDVRAAALGIIGFCMGGRTAYLMAAAVPAFSASIAYYGGGTAQPRGDVDVSPFDRTAEMSCPLLFHFGGEDRNPSPEDMATLDAEMTKHGKEHEFHAYEGAGHAFMDFTGQRHHEEASRVSWPRTLDFLARHLGDAS
jgi:carboxymethylenebutenolidase